MKATTPNPPRVVSRTNEYQRISFARMDPKRNATSIVLQDVPDAADRVEQLLLEPVVDLAAKVIDVHVDHVGAGVKVVIPDMFGENRPGEDPAGVPHEVFEQRILLPGQLDRGVSALRLVRNRVELKVGDLQDGRLVRASPPEESSDACNELGEGEGLREIIVRTGIEASDSVFDGILGREHQDRSLDIHSPQLPQERDPVLLRKKNIEDHEVVSPRSGHQLPLHAVVSDVDGKMLFLEALLEEFCDFLFVFYYENFHSTALFADNIRRYCLPDVKRKLNHFNVTSKSACLRVLGSDFPDFRADHTCGFGCCRHFVYSPANRRIMRISATAVIIAFLCSGCLQQIAVSSLEGIMDTGFEVLNEEQDLDLADKSIASNLKLLDTILRKDPDNSRTLLLACIGYSSYALGFVEDDSADRARLFYDRAKSYGMKILAKRDKFARAVDRSPGEFQSGVVSLSRDDVPAMFWTAVAWGGSIGRS